MVTLNEVNKKLEKIKDVIFYDHYGSELPLEEYIFPRLIATIDDAQTDLKNVFIPEYFPKIKEELQKIKNILISPYHQKRLSFNKEIKEDLSKIINLLSKIDYFCEAGIKGLNEKENI